jgi:hypothetical protein
MGKFMPSIRYHILRQPKSIGHSEFETVKDGCGVLLRNIFGKDQWYILEDRPDANLTQYELNSSQSLYQYLIGKHIGEEVVLVEDNFGRNTLRI